MKIAIIGGGNMGGSIARGLCSSRFFKPEEIAVADPQQTLLDGLTAFNPGLRVSKNNFEVIEDANIILLAVKPWLMEFVISTLKQKIDYSSQIVVSIAATINFDRLHELFEKNNSFPVVFRVVPNTAIAVKQSMTFVCSDNASKEQELSILEIFNELGQSYLIPEAQIEGATALASCGIAYAMRYIRAASEGGVELGFYPDAAKNIVMQTLKGAIALLEINGTHPEAEIDRVTTPGGITIKGLNEMEQAGFTSAVIRGLKASK